MVEGEDVVLILLTRDEQQQEIDCSLQAYKADLANLIRKAADEVVYPIDGIYNGEKCVYELRTSLGDIDKLLK